MSDYFHFFFVFTYSLRAHISITLQIDDLSFSMINCGKYLYKNEFVVKAAHHPFECAPVLLSSKLAEGVWEV